VNYVRDARAAEYVVRLCKEANVDAIAVQANVGVADDVRAMFKVVSDRFGRADILVNNAGAGAKAPFRELEESAWDFVFDVNVKGIYLCSQQAIPLMKAQGRGVIINITSISGQQVWVNSAHYCASKAAADMLTKCMAAELAPLRISVNAIAPGCVDTDMLRSDLSEGELEAALKRTPTERLGAPDDIARTVVFLCDQAGDWLTGEVITVDGGYRLLGNPLPT
jgi:NAD(P)-dependent dehydrogenase (short-subunit alcohol dehydrogenase family)